MNSNVKDLSKTKGTYTKELKDHMNDINLGYGMLGLEDFRNLVKNIVDKAYDTPAKRNFLLTLQRQRTKYEILRFTTNAYLRGSGMGANIYDRFNTK